MRKVCYLMLILMTAALWACGGGGGGGERQPDHTVSFIYGDGRDNLVQPIWVSGQNLTWPENPTRPGYIFVGWDWQEDENPADVIYTGGILYVTRSLSFTAQWIKLPDEPDKFAVAVVLNGGEAPGYVMPQEIVDRGYVLNLPTNLTRDGYQHIGWHINQDNTLFTGNAYTIDKHMVFTAQWRQVIAPPPHMWSVTFDYGDGGTMQDVILSVEDGRNVPWPRDPAAPEGFAFGGWEIGGKLYNGGEYIVYSNLVFTAQWVALPDEPSLATVTIVLNGGIATLEDMLHYTVEIGMPEADIILPTVTREYYNFIGWSSNDSSYSYARDGNNFTVTKSVTFTAQWEREAVVVEQHTVTFKHNYDSAPADIVHTVSDGANVPWPERPARAGYTFGGWKIANNLFNGGNYPVTMDLTFLAEWNLIPIEPNVATVTIILNGGVVSPIDTSLYYTVEVGTNEANITLPTVTRENYEFIGWVSTDAAYVSGTTHTVNENVVFTAQWQKKEYRVTFKYNDGTTEDLVRTVAYGTNITWPGTPSWDGYVFGGWELYSEGIFNSGSYPVTRDLIFSAQWAVDTSGMYTYTIILNGGAKTSEGELSGAVQSGTAINLPTVTRADYELTGWQAGDTAIAANAATYTVTENVIISAQWSTAAVPPIMHNVTFNYNGGTLVGATPPTEVEHGEHITLPTVERIDHMFIGWLVNGDTIDVDSYPVVKDLTLTAQWVSTTDDMYSVAIILNGGTLSGYSMPATTVVSGTSITLPTSAQLSRVGYTFTGWYLNRVYYSGPNTGPYNVTEHVFFSAQWTINRYDVTFDLNGGIFDGNASLLDIDVEHGASPVWPTPPPKRVGYAFAGWTLDASGSVFLGGAYPITQNLSFTAKWNINTYSITFFDGTDEYYAFRMTGVEHGTSINLPSDQAKNGAAFLGWKLRGADGILPGGANIAQVVSNMEYEAVWDAAIPAGCVAGNDPMLANWTVIDDRVGLEGIIGDSDYILLADIDLSGAEWTPIPSFSGILYGNCFDITGLTITEATGENVGLFSTLSGEVNGLSMKAVNIKTEYSTQIAGGIAGILSTNGSISDSFVTGNISVKAENTAYAGGIVGQADSGAGKLTNVYSVTNISAEVTSDSGNNSAAGGIAGYMLSSEIQNAYSAGYITAGATEASAYAGGIVGSVRAEGGAKSINKVYSTATVNAGTIIQEQAHAGGIAGSIGANASIANAIANNIAINSTDYKHRIASADNEAAIGSFTGNYARGNLLVDVAISSATGSDGEGIAYLELRDEDFYSGTLDWAFSDEPTAENPWVMAEWSTYPVLYFAEHHWRSPYECTPLTAEDIAQDGWIPIKRADELAAILNLSDNFYLANDIKLPATNWVPIVGFKGKFHGNCNVISGLAITANVLPGNTAMGLFSDLGGDVSGLALEDAYFDSWTGEDGAAMLAGSLAPGKNVVDSYVTGTINFTSSGNRRIGGLIGVANSTNSTRSNIRNVYAEVYLYDPALVWGSSVGGLIGNSNYTLLDNVSAITNMYFHTNANRCNFGGLVGTGYADIKNAYSIVHIDFEGDTLATSIGGLIGNAVSNCTIEHSYSGGYICVKRVANGSSDSGTVYYSVGGIAGISGTNNKIYSVYSNTNLYVDAMYSEAARVGGIVGNMTVSELKNAYSTGSIHALGKESCEVGGIVGAMDSSSIENVYTRTYITAEGDGTGPVYVGGLVGLFLDQYPQGSYKLDSSIAVNGGMESVYFGGNTSANCIGNTVNNPYYPLPVLSNNYVINSLPYSGDGTLICDDAVNASMVELMTKDFYTNNLPTWAFGDTDTAPWVIDEGESYPYFYWQQ